MTEIQTYLNWLEARGQKFPIFAPTHMSKKPDSDQSPLLPVDSPDNNVRSPKRLVVFSNSILSEQEREFLKKMHQAVNLYCGKLEIVDRSLPNAFDALKLAHKNGDQIILMIRESCEDEVPSLDSASPNPYDPRTLTTAKVDIIMNRLNEKRRFWIQLQKFLHIQANGAQT